MATEARIVRAARWVQDSDVGGEAAGDYGGHRVGVDGGEARGKPVGCGDAG